MVLADAGLWSHSKQDWLDEVLSRVIEPYDWSFVYAEERGTHMSKGRDSQQQMECAGIKDLKKVFRRKDLKARGFRKENTIIVEDTPGNCRRNYGNAIYVSTYDVVRRAHDRELPLLQRYLEKVILGCQDVRPLEKRTWRVQAVGLQKSKEVKKRQRDAPETLTRRPSSDSPCFWALENWQKCVNLIDASAPIHRVRAVAS
ncbi:unnamed protein product [Ostreobium quekettii]|uniref:FCP1 homology domain-containing protein n=1 Tax=Ostreobium quekettii TaxID=121088 RepID=A0A8S1IRY5_9CHLO|nr:unnamed protein product [Ostreobium quekettii]